MIVDKYAPEMTLPTHGHSRFKLRKRGAPSGNVRDSHQTFAVNLTAAVQL